MKNVMAASALALGLVVGAPADSWACKAPVGDFVWHDSNRNGVQDAGEPGINGVRLTISPPINDTQGPSEVVTMSRNGVPGYYQFAALECEVDYTIVVDSSTVPAGYAVTALFVGNTDSDSNDPAGTVVRIAYADPPTPDFSIDFGYTTPCTGAIGDRVWFDANNNGVQDPGELGISGAVVTLDSNSPVATDASGNYLFGGLCAGTYTVSVQIPPGTQVSPANQGADDLDSDGVSNGVGQSVASVTLPGDNVTDLTIDFGFSAPPVQSPGTGTPGYWMNHPDAWPVASISVGGVSYTKEQAISLMQQPDARDKTLTIFSSLVAAKLNVLIGNDSSCVASTISAADAWFTTYGPVGSGVRAASIAWKQGEPLHRTLDNYNNGMLCAPSRD